MKIFVLYDTVNKMYLSTTTQGRDPFASNLEDAYMCHFKEDIENLLSQRIEYNDNANLKLYHGSNYKPFNYQKAQIHEFDVKLYKKHSMLKFVDKIFQKKEKEKDEKQLLDKLQKKYDPSGYAERHKPYDGDPGIGYYRG